MSEKQDNPEKGSKSVGDFEEMPAKEEFSSLATDLQNDLLEKFTPEEDTPGVESKEDDESKSDEDGSKDTQTEKDTQKVETDWEKRYKDLQTEFNSRNEVTKELLTKVDTLEKGLKKETPSQREDRFDKLRKDNPKAIDFIDQLQEAIDERIDSNVKPIHDKLSESTADDNESKFRGEINDFLASDLKGLESELDAYMADNYGDKDKLLAAARKDPNLFETVKDKVIARNLDKVMEIKAEAKGKKSEEEAAKERQKEVDATGVSGKSKTTGKVEEQSTDLESFKKLKSYDEKLKVLNKQGIVDSWVMNNRD